MTQLDMIIDAAERTKVVAEAFANSPECAQQDHRAVVQMIGMFGVFVNELYAVREREGF